MIFCVTVRSFISPYSLSLAFHSTLCRFDWFREGQALISSLITLRIQWDLKVNSNNYTPQEFPKDKQDTNLVWGRGVVVVIARFWIFGVPAYVFCRGPCISNTNFIENWGGGTVKRSRKIRIRNQNPKSGKIEMPTWKRSADSLRTLFLSN